MQLDKIPKSGTTISRKRFWDKARDIVCSLQKKEGRNVSVDERRGLGTLINVLDTRSRSGSGSGPPEPCAESHAVLIQTLGTCGLGTCGCTTCGTQFNGFLSLDDPDLCAWFARSDGISCCSCTTGSCDTGVTYIEITVIDNFYDLGGGVFGARVDIEANIGTNSCIYFYSLSVGDSGEFADNIGVTNVDLVAEGICEAGDAELHIVLV